VSQVTAISFKEDSISYSVETLDVNNSIEVIIRWQHDFGKPQYITVGRDVARLIAEAIQTLT
jgi:hypothetical protein